jgi:L-threonylcarbamoyladenylate synthase
VNTEIGTSVDHAASLLLKGLPVAIPTETVYGLAANALDTDAVLEVYSIKGRPAFNPLIVHVHDFSEFEKYACEIPAAVKLLAARFSPGPLTFVLPKRDIIPDIVTGGGDTVALRIPAHPMTRELLRIAGIPLAAPSANPFGYISPVTASHVNDQLAGKIPYILDGGMCEIGVESTVVSLDNDELSVLRAGGISLEDLRSVVTNVRMRTSYSNLPHSPGQLKSHYAPRVPLVLGDIPELLSIHEGKRLAVLAFSNPYEKTEILIQEVLSPAGDLREAARSLFSALRRLDAGGADVILAERVPEEGLGLAINDRLERAAAGTAS